MSTPDANAPVLLEERPHPQVALLRLNRPKARNALNMAMRTALAEAFDRLAQDDSVRCVVITGNEQAFAAGADLGEFAGVGAIELLMRRVPELWRPIAQFPKPLIAAVNGYALGGGCELAMHADIIVAGQGATFGQPEIRVGIMPGAGGVARLARTVGKHAAMRMLLTGEPVSAAAAQAMGLCSDLVPDDQVLPSALALALKIAAMPPLACAQIKESLLAGLNASLETALALERKAHLLLFASQDKEEGMQAFAERRSPDFQGR